MGPQRYCYMRDPRGGIDLIRRNGDGAGLAQPDAAALIRSPCGTPGVFTWPCILRCHPSMHSDLEKNASTAHCNSPLPRQFLAEETSTECSEAVPRNFPAAP